MRPDLDMADARLAAARGAAQRAASRLLGMQAREGYWQAELTSDSTLESDWVLLLLWLYQPQDGVWSPPQRARIERAAASILARQLSDGGFAIYPGGPAEVSASVKAYCALKLSGIPADGAAMTKLRERILALGGIQAANSFVKINLSLFNLYPRKHVPTVPPELLLGGKLLYQMSSWTRAILVPLSIVQALNRVGRPAPEGFTLSELYKPGVRVGLQRDGAVWSWRNFFLRVDRLLKWWERHGSRSIRAKAVHEAEKWMLARFEHSAGLAAIYPSMMYSIMALERWAMGPNRRNESRPSGNSTGC